MKDCTMTNANFKAVRRGTGIVAHVGILSPAALRLLKGFVVCHAIYAELREGGMRGGILKEFNNGRARVNTECDSFRLSKYSFCLAEEISL
jgi:hypothetical protein